MYRSKSANVFGFRQVVAQCLADSFINDCFLHMISVAPRMNSQLFDLLKLIMDDYMSNKDSDSMKTMNEKVKSNLATLVSICRGLAALLKPQVS